MSDDAPTPAGDAAHDPWPAPASDEADGPQDAVPKVPLDKGSTDTGTPGITGTAGVTGTPGVTGTTGNGAGSVGSPAASNPWAAPGDSAQSGAGHTVAANEPLTPASGSPSVPSDQVPPAVHDQQTVTALPSVPPPPADVTPQPWATPFGNPPVNGPFGAFPPPHPGMAAAGGPPFNPVNPFAPPGAGGAVPPPPLAPYGPGQVPYGYPGGYGYPGRPHYGGGAPGPYGWSGGTGDSNGMGIAGLVLGIVSAVGFCMWPLAVVLGILGITFGAVGRGKARRGEASNAGQALAGIICGSVGVLLAIGLGVLLIVQP
ncbi:DUF4190 domain-containing protein [Streptomyces sp. NBC_00103]|uniref:DUF4190 domain-containing protein n=1 Tax=Streptomyces sp. NBC_00103 TaxID=2975653 RepID=UPI00225769BD|nr:DUF4190 domain-containing protein [Streptomyces sp. NBC_00103]MCX5367634.1 DUF4190 domain-containing protein [Streptomyces sp. NBC_00103]